MNRSLVFLFALLLPGLAFGDACEQSTPDLTQLSNTGWGIDHRNQRYQADTTIRRDNVDRLELAWSYGLSSQQPRFWPLVTRDTVIIGDSGRGIVALDRYTGCERWVHPQEGQISSAIVPGVIDGKTVLVFANRTNGIHAIDAATGEPIWHSTVDDQPVPYYSGTPLVAGENVLVPVSSLEIGLAANPLYGCCTTSGGIASFDLATGEKKWFLATIPEPAEQTGTRWLLIGQYGPSGAPVWGAPTYSRARNTVYFGTGQNYSHPTTDTSDAIFAVDVATGKPHWVKQFTAGDAYNLACNLGDHPNCPKPTGPDIDFGAPPLLLQAGGQSLLIAAQKSADIHAINADTGDVVWQRTLGRGGALGGVHWGIAADERKAVVYIPISDVEAMPGEGTPRPGIFALDAITGDIEWAYIRDHKCATERCGSGFSAAITASDELVFAGSLDGVLEIIDAENGDVLWTFDTTQAFDTVNAVDTSGGAIDAHGPMVAGDQVFLSSGYGTFGQKPGNAFLVFQLRQPDTVDD